MGVDTTDSEVRVALDFLQRYLNDFHRDTLPDFKRYWRQADCEHFAYPDQIIYAISSEYPTYSMGFAPTVYYCRPSNGIVHIRTIFSSVDSGDVISVLCATNHYVRVEGDVARYFIMPMDMDSAHWTQTTMRNVEFHFPRSHRFDQAKADSLIQNIKALESEHGLAPIRLRYYLSQSKEELDRLRGLEFSIMSGNRDKPSGISNDQDNIVYCAGLGENYFHEVVHIYCNRLNTAFPLKEGLAIYYGGSMGHDLQWHLHRLRVYLDAHPNEDLNNFSRFGYFDNYSNPQSALQGLLVLMVLDKHGKEGLRRLIRYNSLEEIFSHELQVEKSEWNKVLREYMKKF